jgi:uncharacterized membrane protein YdjX (TVP38/TMEM64 family)
MRMGFQNGYFGAFFFEPFVTDSNYRNFFIALIFVFLHMFIYTYLTYQFKGNIVIKVLGPFFMFFNMFLIMCYNRWIILGYVIGETLGYFLYRLVNRQKNKETLI